MDTFFILPLSMKIKTQFKPILGTNSPYYPEKVVYLPPPRKEGYFVEIRASTGVSGLSVWKSGMVLRPVGSGLKGRKA